MSVRGWVPRRRVAGVVCERIGDEIVVLDRRSDQAHCLTDAAARVWTLADGSRSPARIAQLAGLSAAAVEQTLAELDRLELLEPVGDGDPERLTRRTATRRTALTGAVVTVLTITLPTPAFAASKTANCGLASGCTSINQPVANAGCASGYCFGASQTSGSYYCVPSTCAGIEDSCGPSSTSNAACCVGTCANPSGVQWVCTGPPYNCPGNA